MKWAEAMRNAVTAALPWPGKHERRAAVRAAEDEHARSRDRAAESRKVQQQIHRLAAQNHYAAKIEDHIIHGHDGGQGGA